ncbi:MAG: right-handed parallel beta-helix repeat-containing protein [candidate division Zixibacteria bacterium]|nr:right-handed parallel beta-helix repeat-containing protein [candidate division Zixibacteria bacterium]
MYKSGILLGVVGLFVFFTGIGHSAVIHVPSEQSTIQAGIDASNNGDTIQVAPGEYVEHIIISENSIVLMASEDAKTTIIVGYLIGQNVINIEGIGNSVVIDGFDISGGRDANGVYIGEGSIAYLENCIIKENVLYSELNGGGIYCLGCNSLIRNCILHDNITNEKGGGIYIDADHTTIDSCDIYDNYSGDGGGALCIMGGINNIEINYNNIYHNYSEDDWGGVIYGQFCSNINILNNTIVMNSALGHGSAITFVEGSQIQIKNNIIAFNSGGIGVYFTDNSTNITYDYNDTYLNYGGNYSGITLGTGCIEANPLFKDTTLSCYELHVNSPCIDMGDPDAQYNDPDSTRSDIGATHFVMPNQPFACLFNSYPDSMGHIMNHTPSFYWTCYDSLLYQTGYIIQIGEDQYWDIAELWDSGEITSLDTNSLYNGDVLLDGKKYYLRIKLRNVDSWGDWVDEVFRMNTIPSTPVQIYPTSNDTVHCNWIQPTILMSNDMEKDSITYNYEVYSDTNDIALLSKYGHVMFNGDTVILPLTTELAGNLLYFWRVRSSDGFEYSDWSKFTEFYTYSPRTIYVPIDYGDIQSAIDAAGNNDTIMVSDGTYSGEGNIDITYNGKSIFMMSENGAEFTIIDCRGVDMHRGITFNSGEDSASILKGFTIMRGELPGGAIYCFQSSPKIEDCIFKNNGPRSAVYCIGASPTISSCVFYINYSGYDEKENYNLNWDEFSCIGTTMHAYGGAIVCQDNANAYINDCEFVSNYVPHGGGGAVALCDSDPIFTNCSFSNNMVCYSGPGGGFHCVESSPQILNCIFTKNISGSDGNSIYAINESSPYIANSSFVFNETDLFFLGQKGSAIYCTDSLTILNTIVTLTKNGCDVICSTNSDISCSNFYANDSGNWSCGEEYLLPQYGNISLDPRFCDTANRNFYLATNSPCAPENNECGVLMGVYPVDCDAICYSIYASVTGNDTTGTGTEANPYRTITKALSMAAACDTVKVMPGEYEESLEIASAVTIESTEGKASTTIRAIENSRVISIENISDTVRLIGFRLTGGAPVGYDYGDYGGGLLAVSSNVIIEYCEIDSNHVYAPYNGGGISAREGSYIELRNNNIHDNTSEKVGAGVMINDPAGGVIENNLIHNNISNNNGSGVFIYSYEESEAWFDIIGNTIINNVNGLQGAGLEIRKTNAIIENNIIAFNGPDDPLFNDTCAGIWASLCTLGVDCNIVYGNCGGNNYQGITIATVPGTGFPGYQDISEHPRFCDADNSDYHIYDISPCAPGNNSCSVLIGVLGVDCYDAVPEITSNSETTVYEDSFYVYRAIFTDPDGPDTNIVYEDYPGWLTPDADSIYGIPLNGNQDTGFTVIVSDGYLADTMPVTITIIPTNDPPVLDSIKSKTVNENSLLEILVTSSDPDGTIPIMTTSELPDGASFYDSLNGHGAFSWQPDYDQSGEYSVIFFATDDSLAIDSEIVPITVVNVNRPPVLDSVGPKTSTEGDTLLFVVTASDPDNTIPEISAIDLPNGASFQDSANGTALFYWEIDYGQAGIYTATLIADDGELADSESVEITITAVNPPIITALTIDHQIVLQHIIDNTPVIEWDYDDPGEGLPQSLFEVAVGIDDDWQYAEMWNPAPFETCDTFVVYSGISLEDGDTYYLRLRVNNSILWSEWYETSFRMNSLPSIPTALHPLDDDICTATQPTLYLSNSLDAEGDTLVYDFMAVVDTAFSEPDPYLGENIAEGEDSTGWQIDEPLHENWRYWWQVRAFDGYEYSDWSDSIPFWINAVEEAPDTFRVYYPPDTSSGIVYNMLSDFIWSGSSDNDPFDSVHYSLYLSTDSQFVFFTQIDSIWEPYYPLADSLYFSTKLYWKAKAIDNTGQFTYSNNVLSFKTWRLGDANGDWEVNLLDILALIDCLYGEGHCPDPVIASDINGDCSVNLLDVLYLISYLYGNPPGPPPVVGCE